MITIKEEFLTCAKTRRAAAAGGAEAVLMWLAMKVYTTVNGTDGFVADDEIECLPGAPRHPRKALEALIGCGKTNPDGSRGHGLVDQDGSGWRLHNYLEHSESDADATERRRLARERKAQWRAQKLNESEEDVPLSQPGQDTGQPTGQDETAGESSQSVPRDSPESVPRAPARDPSTQPTLPIPSLPKSQREEGAEAEPRGRRWRVAPKDFKPTDHHREIATERGVNFELELAKFRDHEFAEPKSDASRAFGNWLRNARPDPALARKAQGASKWS